ncbi:MAG TPA: C4-type zinc ribbon domain-containing protein [Flavobacteriales bacterium]|jgi:predicted  nucleic acid-binding Zn-ribbon protein|nr:C4-type zinc ribbon domain-containing protein [Flavobacteriales bacterium]
MAKSDVKAPEKEVKATKSGAASKVDVTVAEKLVELFRLQHVDSQVDKIRTQRGELPLEVQDLEDEVAGLETRLKKLQDELAEMENQVSDKNNLIKDAKSQIKKYEGQQAKVRNNREYDSLTKEVEFQNLEIQLAEKRIKEAKAQIDGKKLVVEESKARHDDRKKDLELKRKELDDIVAETEKEEKELAKKSEAASKHIEERLLSAYNRIRSNARNGLAVVPVERGSCGGCFNSIPPQRQLDISSHKKIIVCEHCGRILVDEYVVDRVKGEK